MHPSCRSPLWFVHPSPTATADPLVECLFSNPTIQIRSDRVVVADPGLDKRLCPIYPFLVDRHLAHGTPIGR